MVLVESNKWGLGSQVGVLVLSVYSFGILLLSCRNTTRYSRIHGGNVGHISMVTIEKTV